MVSTETTLTAMAAFLLAWGFLNFLWLAMIRRPAVAGTLSLVVIGLLVLLSQLKYQVLMMTANFVDLMVVDPTPSLSCSRFSRRCASSSRCAPSR